LFVTFVSFTSGLLKARIKSSGDTMSPFPPFDETRTTTATTNNIDDDFDDKNDVLSQHASMLAVEIANRIHPNVDFFEEHLEEVKEYALLTIARLEEVKMFLNVKKKKKSTRQQLQRQQSFGVDDDDENDDEETSDDGIRRRMRTQMEIDLSKLTARLEQDFAFIDSARETLNVIERKVSEMEEDVWEKEKAMVKTRVDAKVEQVKDQFGRMFSSMFSSNNKSSPSS